jgi:outer membrane protein assembly factor BamE (lipoprotein component of BamABCDE complex)
MKFFLILPLALLSACSSPLPAKNRGITHGLVQMTLKRGQTTQPQVLEAFGAPNITSLEGDGTEVWTYLRHASRSVGGRASAGLGILTESPDRLRMFGLSAEGFEQSSRAMTLIIRFDSRKIVSDFSSLASSF